VSSPAKGGSRADRRTAQRAHGPAVAGRVRRQAGVLDLNEVAPAVGLRPSRSVKPYWRASPPEEKEPPLWQGRYGSAARLVLHAEVSDQRDRVPSGSEVADSSTPLLTGWISAVSTPRAASSLLLPCVVVGDKRKPATIHASCAARPLRNVLRSRGRRGSHFWIPEDHDSDGARSIVVTSSRSGIAVLDRIDDAIDAIAFLAGADRPAARHRPEQPTTLSCVRRAPARAARPSPG
jgi:hypothetical protein